MQETKRITFDTETAGSLDNPIVYNAGALGQNFEYENNVLINETFFDHELMDTAYYADKRPIYIDELWDSEIYAKDFFAFRDEIHRIIKENPKIEIYAHNAAFDVRALNNTCRYLSNGQIKYFFPYGTIICDTLKMARQVIGKMPSYRKFCEENGYMTKHATPRPRLTAEILYRFITKDNTFEEAHRGKQDVEIEQKIYEYIMKQHKKCNRILYPRQK